MPHSKWTKKNLTRNCSWHGISFNIFHLFDKIQKNPTKLQLRKVHSVSNGTFFFWKHLSISHKHTQTHICNLLNDAFHVDKKSSILFLTFRNIIVKPIYFQIVDAMYEHNFSKNGIDFNIFLPSCFLKEFFVRAKM